MNSLEWINGQIEIMNRKIKFLNSKLNRKHTGITDPLELDLTIEAIQIALSRVTQTLQILNQIKTKLEAWEVVKHTFHIQTINRFNKIPGILIQTLDEEILENVDFEKYEIVKKALEVKDD